jgi:hypothetical protein
MLQPFDATLFSVNFLDRTRIIFVLTAGMIGVNNQVDTQMPCHAAGGSGCKN